MHKPVIVVMAAGLGSRYGGLKQMEKVDSEGHILADYSLYDACRAGFETVVFVINPAWESEFRLAIGDRIAKHVEVRYAFQRHDALPQGFTVPEGRQKPWGTAHAVLCAKPLVQAPFAVINADDYYGPQAMRNIYDFLCHKADDAHYALIGYPVEKTLTKFGTVSRGICSVDETGNLTEIVERVRVLSLPEGAAYEEGGSTRLLPCGALASMNLWGFGLSFMEELERRFVPFLRESLPQNPLGCEYFLPSVAGSLLREGKASISVIPTDDDWYGITYPQDMPEVQAAISALRHKKIYPARLLEGEEC